MPFVDMTSANNYYGITAWRRSQPLRLTGIIQRARLPISTTLPTNTDIGAKMTDDKIRDCLWAGVAVGGAAIYLAEYISNGWALYEAIKCGS